MFYRIEGSKTDVGAMVEGEAFAQCDVGDTAISGYCTVSPPQPVSWTFLGNDIGPSTGFHKWVCRGMGPFSDGSYLRAGAVCLKH